MHAHHPSFKYPEELRGKIWQYMDLAQFVSMLQRRQLFFVKANRLRDPYEGMAPEHKQVIEKYAADMRRKKTDDKTKKDVHGLPSSLSKQIMQRSRTFGEIVLINSWHYSDYESAAMWQLYSQENLGIAIQSTVDRLSRCFHANTVDTIWIGKVEYLDYNMEEQKTRTHPLNAFVQKRKSFEYEQEIRAVTCLDNGNVLLEEQRQKLTSKKAGHSATPQAIGKKKDQEKDLTDKGKYVDADLSMLVESVYVAPFSESWFNEVIESLLSKYDLNADVVKSDLYTIY